MILFTSGLRLGFAFVRGWFVRFRFVRFRFVRFGVGSAWVWLVIMPVGLVGLGQSQVVRMVWVGLGSIG